MDTTFSSSAEELLRNAELRTELIPYSDESVTCVDSSDWSLRQENQFLSSMLQWEQAPILPIYKWFEPGEISLPSPQAVSDDRLPKLLSFLAHKLYEKHIVLDHTDHLSDRDLYRIIVLKILPQNEKKLELVDAYRHWDCSRVAGREDELEDAKTWLTYYASDAQRECWAAAYGEDIPEKKIPCYHRDFPRDDSFQY